MMIQETFWKQTDHRDSFRYARALTSQHARSFYLAARLLPPDRRWATYALYGFCRYADNLVDTVRDRTPTEVMHEVATLSEELVRAYRSGESEHPVIRPFIVVAKAWGIPAELPLTLLQGVVMDIDITRYETFDDLYTYCYRVAGVVGLMMTHILGYSDDDVFIYAEQLGIAMQLTNILRDIEEDMAMGRMYLPSEDLVRFGVSEQDIVNGRMTEVMREMMRFYVTRAHGYYNEANKGIPLLEKKSRFTITSASRIYRGILGKIEARNFDPFQGRVFVPTSSKFGIIIGELLRSRLSLGSGTASAVLYSSTISSGDLL